MTADLKPVRNVLYVASAEQKRRVYKEVGSKCERLAPHFSSDHIVLRTETAMFRLRFAESIDEALAILAEHYLSYIVVDARHPRSQNDPAASLAVSFIEKLHYTGDPNLRFPLSRIVAIVERNEHLLDHVFKLGQLRIGGVVTHPFPDELLSQLKQLYDPDPGKTAICLSGGGLEGFLFQIGILRALNAHLQNRSVCDVDIHCGISAGAILSGFLANNAPPELIEFAMTTNKAVGNIEPVRPSIIFDPNYAEFSRRLISLGAQLSPLNWNDSISGLLKSIPNGLFRGETLYRFLRRQLNQPGRTDDFRQLERELYIGATDQDTSSHVVFGDGQWRDVPISQAIRASVALTPFFEPFKIRGRYFVDGQYTRTSNFHLAIERGAKLVILVDPLVPIRTNLPGYVQKKGGVFSGLQALKAVIHSRFMHAYQAALHTFPNVDFILFKPEGDVMRHMSGSPMKYTIRTGIIQTAYECGVRQIQRDFEILEGTFARHGLRLQREPRPRDPFERT